MPTLPCPACDKPAARMPDDAHEDVAVNHYRCERCGHHWTTVRNGSNIVKHITPLTRKPPSRQ